MIEQGIQFVHQRLHVVSGDEIVDVWRGDGERFVHSWEDRFVVQEGYTPRMIEAVNGLLEKTGRKADPSLWAAFTIAGWIWSRRAFATRLAA